LAKRETLQKGERGGRAANNLIVDRFPAPYRKSKQKVGEKPGGGVIATKESQEMRKVVALLRLIGSNVAKNEEGTGSLDAKRDEKSVPLHNCHRGKRAGNTWGAPEVFESTKACYRTGDPSKG